MLTFNDMPIAISRLTDRLERIELLLMDRAVEIPVPDEFMDTEQAADFLKVAVPTIYGLVHKKGIPVFKLGKQLRFSRKALTEWVESGRQQTQKEIEAGAREFINSMKS